MGESPPFDDFRLTHSICARCLPSLESQDYAPSTWALAARELFATLFSHKGQPRFVECLEFVHQAQAVGLSRCNMLLGILQPALYAIGSLWRDGLVTVAQEHAFTAWCQSVLDLFPPSEKVGKQPRVLLVCAPGNQHFLGIRLVALCLEDQGVGALSPEEVKSDPELIELCQRLKPQYLGVSVSLPESIPSSLRWARSLQTQIGPSTRLVLGGRALRDCPLELDGLQVVGTVPHLLQILSTPRSET